MYNSNKNINTIYRRIFVLSPFVCIYIYTFIYTFLSLGISWHLQSAAQVVVQSEAVQKNTTEKTWWETQPFK